MDHAANQNASRLETDRQIRNISGRAHLLGLSTPFTHSALVLYDAGGSLDAKTEGYMLQADFLTRRADGRVTLSEDGSALLSACRTRGDMPAVWAQEMAAKAAKAPRFTA